MKNRYKLCVPILFLGSFFMLSSCKEQKAQKAPPPEIQVVNVIKKDVQLSRFKGDTGPSGGSRDSSPVGIFTKDGCFDQGGVGNGFGNCPGIIRGRGILDMNLDHFRDAFTILDQFMGQFEENIVQYVLKTIYPVVVFQGNTGKTIGHEERGVVGAGIAIDDNAVQRVVH